MNNCRPLLKIFTLIIFLAAVSCGQAQPPSPTQTPVSIIETMTLTPSAIVTMKPTQTKTSTATSAFTTTATNTPTISPTFHYDNRSLSLTPLPTIIEPISIDNTNQIHKLAVWGSGAANDLAISPDGQILAVGTQIGCTIYDSTSFERLTVLETAYAVQSIAFSTDNQFIALGQNNKTIDVYQMNGYARVFQTTLTGWDLPTDYKISLHFSPGDSHLISVIETNTEIFINRWLKSSWQFANAFSIDSGRAVYINESTDLIGGISDGRLTLQSLTYPDESDTISLPDEMSLSFWDQYSEFQGDIAPSSYGNVILINNGSSVLHWQLLEDEITYRLEDYPEELPNPCLEAPDTCLNSEGDFSLECAEEPGIPPIELIALTPENYMVLVSLNEGGAEFRRAMDGLLDWEIDSTFTKVAFSPGGEYLFGLTPQGAIEKRATLTGDLIDLIYQHPSRLYALDFSSDSGELAAGYNDGFIRVFRSSNGQMLGVLNGSAQALKFSPDNLLLASGLEDGTVRIFELMEGRYYDLGDGHQDGVSDLIFTSDGEGLLTGSNDCSASLWDLGDRYRIQNVKPDADDPFRVRAVERSPSTLKQYFCGNRNGIYVVEGRGPGELMFFSEHDFRDIALSPDGKTLAATGAESWLLPANTSAASSAGRPLDSGLESEGHALAFSPDGTLLIIATDQGLDFWSVKDGEHLRNLPFPKPITSGDIPVDLTISPDGSLIALANRAGLITIYGIPEINVE